MDTLDLSQVDTARLPHSLRALIDCIGVEQAYRLTCLYGGRPRYIPKNPARSALAQLLPAAALEALTARFAGTSLEIPKPDHFERQLRDRRILEESTQGLSRAELANRYGLSLRQIGNIRRSQTTAQA
ncbi:Mor transcription activator family protein [Pseudomonas sp. RIT-PI-S]|uniref:Mor transcription activator family protein n=1 Tax=Pseudomonas sp. RIT-PI-S TaxID=3035295 RepID=UPI0021D83193|nr:Mor transcription activator family protein [Pseudomonas sp. RIT-PI-S]